MKTITSALLTLAFLAPLGLSACAESADPPVEAEAPAPEATSTSGVTEPNGERAADEEALGIEPGTTNNIGELPEDGDVKNLQGDSTDIDDG